MAENSINAIRHRLKEGEIPLQVKFDGNILEVWFQQQLSREKEKLNGHLGKLAAMLKEFRSG